VIEFHTHHQHGLAQTFVNRTFQIPTVRATLVAFTNSAKSGSPITALSPETATPNGLEEIVLNRSTSTFRIVRLTSSSD
jgi:hypothetical protein